MCRSSGMTCIDANLIFTNIIYIDALVKSASDNYNVNVCYVLTPVCYVTAVNGESLFSIALTLISLTCI